LQDLSRHTAVITGSSSGIGEAAARIFAARGAKLVLAARRADRLTALAHELEGLGAKVMVKATDVTNEQEVIDLFNAAEKFSPVTLLLNNAGIISLTPILDCTIEHWNDVINLNLTGAFLCGREAVRVMKPRGRGRIINIGSLSAQIPRPNSIAYTASKFGMEGITRGLALEARPWGITASIIHPGSTISEFGGKDPTGLKGDDKTMEAEHVAEIAALMAAVPDEVNLLTATVLPINQPYLGRG
jgi:NAD(P)-dependent dehydrogenase (short-subunit alcohol dehydrogenase family)